MCALKRLCSKIIKAIPVDERPKTLIIVFLASREFVTKWLEIGCSVVCGSMINVLQTQECRLLKIVTSAIIETFQK